MNAISQLTQQHRLCDADFALAEEAVRHADWPKARAVFQAFHNAMLQHFSLEEDSLFPAFEAAIGSSMGPTAVMRSEHAQMRALMQDMVQLLSSEQATDYLGCADTLLILMQQHNMKEENILYPMCSQQIADFDAMVNAGSAA
ncbi:hemerythrin domain-containing protein [Aquitalea denitrificans]|uniref:hemerythrin domain-containing protein n=1 Tax=Aquitalea denitrificans TaxID=519081 RepID=UPI00135817EA|nr:hemerythrin domain-containing protein [Aquitalea denitrificans]